MTVLPANFQKYMFHSLQKRLNVSFANNKNKHVISSQFGKMDVDEYGFIIKEPKTKAKYERANFSKSTIVENKKTVQRWQDLLKNWEPTLNERRKARTSVTKRSRKCAEEAYLMKYAAKYGQIWQMHPGTRKTTTWLD